jgi:predicted ribosome quality control (RQC) complex YloA/Tae2 family protein
MAASNVIAIGHQGANVSNTTWINNIYGIATISGVTVPVLVSDAGQLGTNTSSKRFKKDIRTMEKASEAILSLRPVTFHYKSDVKDTPQFGLVAEEVAKVNSALVVPDKEGKPYTVRYDAVNTMLLNEFLKEHRRMQEQQATIAQLRSTVNQQQKRAARQEKQIAALASGLEKVSAQIGMSRPAPQIASNEQ